MKQTNITIIKRTDGTYKIIPARKDKLLQGLKRAGVILAAVLIAILFCGAAITSEHPAKVVQAIFLFGAAAFAIISAVVWSVAGGGEEKSKNNRKTSKRR